MQTLIIFEYLHAATRANSRCYHAFQPVVEQYMANNPQAGHMKLVVIAWDSRHIPVPHSSSFDHQTRLYSTKIHDNAIVKLVGSAMDAKAVFLYMFSASTSPSNTDESSTRYLLQVEENHGE